MAEVGGPAMSCTMAPGSYRAMPMPVSAVTVPGAMPGAQSFPGLRTAPQAAPPSGPVEGSAGGDHRRGLT
eukprot:s2297_g7.t1